MNPNDPSIEATSSNNNNADPQMSGAPQPTIPVPADQPPAPSENTASPAPTQPSVQPPYPINPVVSTSGGGKAIASLVLGIVSLALGVLGLIFAVPGLILGILDLKSRRRGLAIAGIILSGLGIVISIVLMLVLGSAFSLFRALPAPASTKITSPNTHIDTPCYSVTAPESYTLIKQPSGDIINNDPSLCQAMVAPIDTSLIGKLISVSTDNTNLTPAHVSLEDAYKKLSYSVQQDSKTPLVVVKTKVDGTDAYKISGDTPYATTKDVYYLLFNPKGYVIGNKSTATKAVVIKVSGQADDKVGEAFISTFKWK